VFRLGHPLDARLVPVYADLGYRLRPRTRLRPYGALGLGFVSYSEKSSVAGIDTKTSRTSFSARGALGAAWTSGRFELGAELGYAFTPDTIGVGGVSKIYGEKDLGGFSAAATVTWRLRGAKRASSPDAAEPTPKP
jgi:hypothetical protein